LGRAVREEPPNEAAAPELVRKALTERRCVECGIKLSQYNPGPNCWQHTMGWPWRGPSAKPRF
jgi:hypothetical protein